MKIRGKVLVKSMIASGLLMTACGKDTNLNQIFKTSGENERLDSLIAVGQVHFDQGEYDQAEEYAQKAYDRNNDSEDAALLLAYTKLGQAGINPFTIAKKLILKSEESKASNTTKLAETTSAASALEEFADFISISTDDIDSMIETESVTEYADIFGSGFSIPIPKEPDAADGPRNSVNTIKKLVEAIKVICPFVSHPNSDDATDTGAIVKGYALHDCEPTKHETKLRAKSNFLWGLAHLVEAVAYNTVILQSGTASAGLAGTTTTALQQKAEKLKSVKPTLENITEYVGAVSELKEDVSKVLDTSKGGMLYTVLADLKAVSGGFDSIVGMPKDIKSKIDNAINSITSTLDTLSTGSSEADELEGKSNALKQQLNAKVSSDVKDAVEKFNTEFSDQYVSGLPPEKQTEITEKKSNLCTAYQELAQGVDVPKGCPKS